MKTYQVAIVGGGMVGAAIALGLAQQGREIVLIENQMPELWDASQPVDLRVSAISMASVRLLEKLGAWQIIEQMRTCPYRRLETWEDPTYKTSFDADLLGLDQLGFMVENRLIQLGLWQRFQDYPNLTLMCPQSIDCIRFDADRNTLVLADQQEIGAQWVIGADGANSKVRDMAGIGITAWDYRQRCMLIHVRTELPHQDVTWQQFFPSGPRSFLPLTGNEASLVWYDSPKRIKQLSHLSNEQLEQEIQAHFPSHLGRVKVIRHGSFALTRRHAQKYMNRRCILVGDSAHTIHPLAGQGVNLGFKDVNVLLGLMEDALHLDEKLFRQYGLIRRPDNLLMQTGMDIFYKSFRYRHEPVRQFRNMFLKLANHAGPLKKQVLKYAIGL
ncbi:2-octaprenyl-3-methyl-6-methoxy-1,4-benzoquinol hydroxylase [Vibrio aerogenes CECT 7868]|uniref:2-octaprenyl-3-methyl-6-methoxy-1,4-benzoquinol hydroxylase n=1 Tax=Vibrio aerogenes CECT 7868 TaxID=1216006 RepID=A0A1M5Z0U5_9VIBR|nr:2-octaprenyl-3-methyl-6-methoxy-1,4-benzoquinol hydroxylase [Vibrio aerogenes]SHI17820.1 2-octaprenyl-3-methyl-6-methoxy-1,4-benzoquinol hydroxylase [Vibrio aerogenes CECT 7868]